MRLIWYKKKATEEQTKAEKGKCAVCFETDEDIVAKIERENDILSQRHISAFLECQNKAESDALKRCLGIPITKTLRHMLRVAGGWEEEPVYGVEIADEYPGWCILKIILENDESNLIHHAFFSQMQTPSFIDDMKKGEKNEDNED